MPMKCQLVKNEIPKYAYKSHGPKVPQHNGHLKLLGVVDMTLEPITVVVSPLESMEKYLQVIKLLNGKSSM